MPNKRAYVNKYAFSSITEKSAYWTGFLMADGSIVEKSYKNPRICLNLSKKDKNHLIKFKKFLDGDFDIKDYENRSCEIRFTSNKIAKDLKKFGEISNKNTNGKINILNKNKHFWRGMIDGDGYLTIRSQSLGPALEFTNAKNVVVKFKNWLNTFVNTNASIKHEENYSSIQLGGHNLVTKIIETIYKNCKVALTRKEKIAENILNKFN